MTIPIAACNAGIYSFHWSEEGIRIRVDRLLEDNRGGISGEVTVLSEAPGNPGHIHATRLNLLSSQAKIKLAVALKTKVEHLDWQAIIEQLCVMTVERHRQGEPVLDLGTAPDYDKKRYRLHPVLLEGAPNLLFAPAKTTKSYLALYTGCLVQYNQCGIYGWLPQCGNVLVLDWETSHEEYLRRCWAIKQGLGIRDDSERIKYRYCTQSLPTDIAEIQKIVVDHDIKLAIVDSAGYAAGGDPNDAQIALRFYGAVRTLRITTLIIDHTAKGNNDIRTPFGSVYKINSARNIFELKKSQEVGHDQIELAMHHLAMNEGRLLQPMGFRVVFTNDREGVANKVEFTATDLMKNPDLAKGIPLARRIQHLLLTSGRMETIDIATELDASIDQVRARLNDNKGKFKHFTEGWGVLAGDKK
jgi:hypothetical protein